jgi:hypothetical protein
VNAQGYEVLQSLWDSTLEGFITYLVELPPEDSQKILASHKIVHGLYLGIKSVNAQVNGYMQLLTAEKEEAVALQKALGLKYGDDPLENTEVLNKLLNPIYQPQAREPRTVRALKEPTVTVLDKMLEARQSAQNGAEQ